MSQSHLRTSQENKKTENAEKTRKQENRKTEHLLCSFSRFCRFRRFRVFAFSRRLAVLAFSHSSMRIPFPCSPDPFSRFPVFAFSRFRAVFPNITVAETHISYAQEPAFSQTDGSTKVTAIAMPESLLTRRYRRQVKLVHVEKDELCVWHPRSEDMDALGLNGIEVVYIEGTTHWLGGKKHNYGHLTVAELPPGTHDIHSLLNNKACCPKRSATKQPCA